MELHTVCQSDEFRGFTHSQQYEAVSHEAKLSMDMTRRMAETLKMIFFFINIVL
jgi:hypothetical protein